MNNKNILFIIMLLILNPVSGIGFDAGSIYIGPLNADLLNGYDSSDFAIKSVDENITGTYNFSNGFIVGDDTNKLSIGVSNIIGVDTVNLKSDTSYTLFGLGYNTTSTEPIIIFAGDTSKLASPRLRVTAWGSGGLNDNNLDFTIQPVSGGDTTFTTSSGDIVLNPAGNVNFNGNNIIDAINTHWDSAYNNVTAYLDQSVKTTASPSFSQVNALWLIASSGLRAGTNTFYTDTFNDRVGVGTTGPDTVLELQGYDVSGIGLLHLDSNDDAYISIDSGYSNYYNSGIHFANVGVNYFNVVYDSGEDRLEFNDAVNSKHRLIINRNGYIGVNNTNPTVAFEVNGTIKAFNLTDGISDSSQWGYAYSNTSSYLNQDVKTTASPSFNGLTVNYIKTNTWTDSGDNTLLLGDGAGNIQAIAPITDDLIVSGNVGIGTSSPSSLLELSGDSPALTINASTGSGSISFKEAGNDRWSIVQDTINKLHFDWAGVHKITFDGTSGNGYAGFGTDSPEASLFVKGSNADSSTISGVGIGMSGDYASIELKGTSNSAGGGFIDFGYVSDDYRGRILYDNANNYFRFYTNHVLGLTIDSSQRVGIGTGTPAFPLDVYNSAGFLIRLRSDGSASKVGLRIDAVDDSYIDFYENGGLMANIYWDAGNDKLILNGRTYDSFINPSGGNVAIGTWTTSSAKLYVAGTTQVATSLEVTNTVGGASAIILHNTDITGVNQVVINDYGEGIKWADQTNTQIISLSSGRLSINAQGTSDVVEFTSYGAYFPINTANNIITYGGMAIGYYATPTLSIYHAGTIKFYDDINDEHVEIATNSYGDLTLTVNSGYGYLNNGGNHVLIWKSWALASPTTYSRTTTASANVYIDSSGNFARSTSNARYKTNITNLTDNLSDKVFDLRPVTFTSLADADNPNDTHVGLIAEEVNEVLPEIVFHNNTGGVEGVEYDKVGVLLLNEVKELKNELEIANDKINKLEIEIKELKK